MTEHGAGHGRWQAKADGEWYDRGWVPHRDGQRLTQAITFRLGDSLPQARLARLRVELAALDDTLAAQGTASAERAAVVARERQQRILAWLDAGYGSCLLRDAPCAAAAGRGR